MVKDVTYINNMESYPHHHKASNTWITTTYVEEIQVLACYGHSNNKTSYADSLPIKKKIARYNNTERQQYQRMVVVNCLLTLYVGSVVQDDYS